MGALCGLVIVAKTQARTPAANNGNYGSKASGGGTIPAGAGALFFGDLFRYV